MADLSHQCLRFGSYRLDRKLGELTGPSGERVALRPRSLQLLEVFLEHPFQLLSRNELIARLWPDRVVGDDSLVQCVGELRAALEDRDQKIIRTVPRRGYRWDLTVESDSRIEVVDPIPAALEATLPDVSEPILPSVSRTRGPKWHLGFALAATLAVFGLVSGAAVWLQPGRGNIDSAVADSHVFAIMPFAAPTATLALREAGERLADDIAAQLVARGGMRSVGRSRTQSLPAVPLGKIAEGLGVTYVITGRLSEPYDPAFRASVDLQLHLAATGAVVGSQRFDLTSGPDAFDDVGQQVTNFVRGAVSQLDEVSATRLGHVQTPADLIGLGWHAIYRRQGAGDRGLARGYFEEALRTDPNSLLALTGLGAAYLQERTAGDLITPEQRVTGENAIARALRLGPENASATLNWANLQSIEGHPELALPAIERSHRIFPGYANGHLMKARALLSVGRFEEVQPEAERAVRLASLSKDSARASAALQLSAEVQLMTGRDSEAVEFAQRALAERPTNAHACAILAAALSLSGRLTDARLQLESCRRMSPKLAISGLDAARPSNNMRYLAARDRVYQGLSAAGLPAS